MSDYLAQHISRRLRVFIQNEKKSLGGGWHVPEWPAERKAEDYKVKRTWNWVPHGFSSGYAGDFNRLKDSNCEASCQGCWGGALFKIGGYECRWCEDLKGYFRNVRECHKISDPGHTGWYTRYNDYDEITRGLVLQLPGRDGAPRFMIACSDPCNENTGIVEQEIYDDENSAARAADQLAEAYAEDQKEYDLKDKAEQVIENCKNDIKETRNHIKELVAGLRTSNLSDIVCKELRLTIKEYRESVRESIARIRKIENDPYCLIKY